MKAIIIRIFGLISLLFYPFGCSNHDSDLFDDQAFYSRIETDRVCNFVRCIKILKSRNCTTEYFPNFLNLGIEDYLNIDRGDTSKLTAIPFEIISFAKNDLKSDFLAATIYLNFKNLSTKKLFDDMLEVSIKMDSVSLIGQYELAKLRYNESYIGLSAFLIDRLNRFYPNNSEVYRIQQKIKELYGDSTYNKNMNLEEYLSLNPHFIED